jgi:uncharacterized membrane protein
MRASLLAHIRRQVVRGLFMVLPLLITVWLLGLLFTVINDNVTPWVQALLQWLGMPGLDRGMARHLGVPLIGLFLTVLVIYLIGLLGGNLAGRRLLSAVESLILRVPLVKGIYGSARQLLDAFSFSGERTFSRVVMIEYPRRGLWTLGFVTTDVEHRLAEPAADQLAVVPVFLPTTPNPTSGWMMLVPTRDLVVVNMTIEEGIKMIVSGGIVAPPDLGSLVRPWSLREGPAATG